MMWRSIVLAALASTAAGAQESVPNDYERFVKPFFQRHCLSCHDAEEPEGELDLSGLAPSFRELRTAELWEEIRERVVTADMPPADHVGAMPSAADRDRLGNWITARLRENVDRHPGRAVLRRLNRVEYRNTIRDLCGVDYGAAANFPADPSAHGFDNVGAALHLSPVLMERYLEAAEAVVDRLLQPETTVEAKRWRIEVERVGKQFGRAAGQHEVWVDDPHQARHRYIRIGRGRKQNGCVVLHSERDRAGFRWFKIPAAGRYRIRVQAAARVPTRDQVVESAREATKERWSADEWAKRRPHFVSELIYDYGAPRMKLVANGSEIVGTVTVDNRLDAPQVYEFEHDFKTRETSDVAVRNVYSVPRLLENFWFQGRPEFARPELHVDWIEFEGPLPVRPRLADGRHPVFGDESGRDARAVRRVLERFARRAWRRPLSEAELDGLVARTPTRDGLAFEERLRLPLITVLSSPHFLFVAEPGAGRRTVTPHELASRLSYFLWSSMPDEQLFRAADNDQLGAEQLSAHVGRMLADERAAAFVTNFAGQWLGLRELGANPPVAELHRRYDEHLQESMRRESEAFFAELLHHEIDVGAFLDSDFLMLNERLARFYGVPGVRGDAMRRVPRPDGVSQRGGLLGQAAILTVTSNGTRTSPVVRGAWVLEALLGTPPPPPPPDAGDLQPEVPGIDKATVVDRLRAHRELERCATCHAKIDGWGLALENFDAHGRWREQYGFGWQGRVGDRDPVVDAAATLADGTSLTGFGGLRDALKARRPQFLAALTDKLMVYALARGLTPADRLQRDAILAQAEADGVVTLSELILGIVESRAFGTRG